MPTWDNEYLQRLTQEAEKEISRALNPIWDRYAIPIVAGTATYTLPDYVRGITNIKWKGISIDPLYQSEVIKSIDHNYFTTRGNVRWYLRSPENFQIIRFVMVPNENITTDPVSDDLFNSDTIRDRVIVSFHREPDTSGDLLSLPDYVARRLVKNYVLYRAYKKEGTGQHIEAALYYKRKYDQQLRYYRELIGRYTMSNQGISSPSDYNCNDMPRLQAGFNIFPIAYAVFQGLNDSLNFFFDSISFEFGVESSLEDSINNLQDNISFELVGEDGSSELGLILEDSINNFQDSISLQLIGDGFLLNEDGSLLLNEDGSPLLAE